MASVPTPQAHLPPAYVAPAPSQQAPSANPPTSPLPSVPVAAPAAAPAPAASLPYPQASPRQARPTRAAPPAPHGALEEDTLRTFVLRLDRQTQTLLDRVAPFKVYRWLSLAAVLCIFILRMIVVEGFYIVAYVLFIFILNQFILFLQPKDRAALLAKALSSTNSASANSTNASATPGNGAGAGGAGGAAAPDTDAEAQTAQEQQLPTFDDEEFRPFVRRLPEFKFWYSATYATTLAFFATFFRVFDVPVFWPLLLFYFIVLFVATMRNQWLDMKRLKYVPWDIGSKKVYRSDPKRVSVSKKASAQQQHAAAAAPGRPEGAPPTAVQARESAVLPPVPTIQVAPKKAAAAVPAPHRPPA